MLKNILILLLTLYSGVITFIAFKQSKLTLMKLEQPTHKAAEWTDADFADLIIKK